MHNEFLKKLNRDGSQDYYFWEDFNYYCENFEIPDKELFVDSLPNLYDRIKGDGASYTIFQALRNFASEQPEEAIEVLDLIEKNDDYQGLSFIASLLGGLYKSETDYPIFDKIITLLNSSDENKILSGVEAAYQVNLKENKNELEFLNEVHINLVKIIDKESFQHLGIIARFYNKHLNTIIEAKDVIIKLLEKKNVEVQSEVARSINSEFKLEEDSDHFRKCLTLLTFTNTKYKGIYRTINYRLKETIITQPEIIIEFINAWILNNKTNLKNITAVKEIVHELYLKHPNVIQQLFLDWLNSNNSTYKFAIQFVISDLSGKVDVVGLPKESLKELSENDSLYIVFMIVGHILDRKYASEMLYNILEVNYKNERIRNHVATLFVRYLIINYYSVTDILKSKRQKANKTIASIINQILDKSEEYYQQVSELELVNEFEPSDKRMQYFLKQQNVKMQQLMNESELKKDSFLSMLNNVSLKAGKSFFSKYRGEYSQEAEMQNFRSSFEIARVQFIDEIGQEKLRLMWQNMKRDELPN